MASEQVPETMQSVEALIANRAQAPLEWSEPTQFDLTSWADQQEVARRFADGQLTATIDRVDIVADDLFEMRHPHLKNDDSARRDFVDDIVSQGAGYGNWIAFDWNKTLVRYPEKQDHQGLRTFRNKKLITESEQEKLLDERTTVGVFGLSVGSSVVKQLALGGVGGTIAMGDFDTLTPSNLNRLDATMAEVGMRKLDIAAIKVSEADPYIEQVHFREGMTADSLPQLGELQPSILVDAIDNLAMKAVLRRFAQERRIPLVMSTDLGDKSIIDVERYDLGDTELFNGQISSRDIERLEAGDLTPSELRELTMKLVGVRHITTRLLDSSMEVGQTLGGIPQLGATASVGGALATIAAREIILGRRLQSGRYVSSPKKILGLESASSLGESIAVVHRFAKQRRQ